LAFLWVQCVFY